MSSYMSRVWMAASVVVVRERGDQGGIKWKAGLKPCYLVASGEGGDRDERGGRTTGSKIRSGEERRQHAEESLQKAMFVSCWSPS